MIASYVCVKVLMHAPFHIFDLFTRMITDVPASGILNELDLESRMLENDLWRRHLPMTREAFSILRFCQFVHAVKTGQKMCSVQELPPDHIEFYKTTVVRLIHANELPFSAAEQFDHTFIMAA
jgi:hypothetical protein